MPQFPFFLLSPGLNGAAGASAGCWGRVRGPSAALGDAGGTKRCRDAGCNLNPDLKGV